ncbi:MAG TPA: N-6 DNA methylase, partial [Chthoniobacteraceae bacterium]
MKTVLADLFARLVARIGSEDFPALALGAQSPPEQISPVGAVIGSAAIEGVEGAKKEPHALFVIAAPSLAPDSSNLLTFAARRAQAQRTPYFVIWTLRDAVLWRTPKPGTAIVTADLEKLRDYEDNYDISPTAGAEIFNETRRRELLSRGERLLHDLTRLYQNQALELVQVEATYFVERLLQSVHALLPLLSSSLIEQLEMKLDLRAKVQAWAVIQGIAGGHDDPAYCDSIARQIIYRLLGKILFYQSLRRAARQLPALDLDGVETSQVLPTLRAAFREALKIDYHAVFAEDVPDTLNWPAAAAKELAALVHDFNTRDFAQLPQDVVGTVFERLIPPEERHALGQYFTPEPLCDLTLAFCVRSATDNVLDPTCGTGTFVLRGYDRLRWLGCHDHATLLSRLWGIDIAPFPAELAVINLFRQNLTTAENFPRIACRDFLSLSPGDTLPFPPPKMDVTRPAQIDEPIPEFDAIVGNFPYVSADQIEKRQGGYLEIIRERLLDGWFVKYPRLFKFPGARQADFEKLIALKKHAGFDRAGAELRVTGFADLYVYLFFHAARFLRPGGRIGIVTSNAWLDVEFGYELQRFFCDHFKIVAILESRCEPWFTEASVNTVLTILERCDDAKARDANLVSFVKVKLPLAALMPGDARLEAMARWKRAANLATRIECAGRGFAKTHPLGVRTEENDEMRVRVRRQGELREEVEAMGKTVKWGEFLRAPEVFFEMHNAGKLCVVADLTTSCEFGSKTGVNEFYHVTRAEAAEWKIEPEFLRPLLKSPGDEDVIPIDVSSIERCVFVCRMSLAELAKKKKVGALAYIRWGETQRFMKGSLAGMTWPHGIEVRNRQPGWYALPEYRAKPARVFLTKAYHDRHVHRYSQEMLIADQRLYFMIPRDGIADELLAALLNSSITALCTETVGRVALGA